VAAGEHPDVRRVLLNEFAKNIPRGERVALLLSGGIDSLACGLALRELGYDVTAYSFMLDGIVSTDFARARSRAEKFGFDFQAVILPTDIDTLANDLRELAGPRVGARTKTDFECGWPVARAIREVRERYIVTGHGADGHFCISKKGMIHYRDRIDVFRAGLFSNPRYAQRTILDSVANYRTMVFPFLSEAMVATFAGTTWNDVNRPRQKQPILDAYPEEFARVKIDLHTNLQLGDSGIAEHFKILLTSPWNTMNAKSPVAIYNEIVRRFA
jgi:hypothetical protein